MRKISTTQEFDLRTVQPVASRYPAHNYDIRTVTAGCGAWGSVVVKALHY
jgi:hypothetical protein